MWEVKSLSYIRTLLRWSGKDSQSSSYCTERCKTPIKGQCTDRHTVPLLSLATSLTCTTLEWNCTSNTSGISRKGGVGYLFIAPPVTVEFHTICRNIVLIPFQLHLCSMICRRTPVSVDWGLPSRSLMLWLWTVDIITPDERLWIHSLIGIWWEIICLNLESNFIYAASYCKFYFLWRPVTEYAPQTDTWKYAALYRDAGM